MNIKSHKTIFYILLLITNFSILTSELSAFNKKDYNKRLEECIQNSKEIPIGERVILCQCVVEKLSQNRKIDNLKKREQIDDIVILAIEEVFEQDSIKNVCKESITRAKNNRNILSILLKLIVFCFFIGYLLSKFDRFQKKKNFRIISYCIITFLTLIISLLFLKVTYGEGVGNLAGIIGGIIAYWFYLGTRVQLGKLNEAIKKNNVNTIKNVIGIFNIIGGFLTFIDSPERTGLSMELLFLIGLTRILFGISLFIYLPKRNHEATQFTTESKSHSKQPLRTQLKKTSKWIVKMITFKNEIHTNLFREGTRRIILIFSLVLPIYMSSIMESRNVSEFILLLVFFYIIFHGGIYLINWIKKGYEIK